MPPWLGWVHCDVNLVCEVKHSSEVQGSWALATPKLPMYCLLMRRSVHFLSTFLSLLPNT